MIALLMISVGGIVLFSPGPTGEATSPVHPRSLQSGPGWSPLPPPHDFWYERADPALGFSTSLGLGILYGGLVNGTTVNDAWVNDGDEPGNWVIFSSGRNASPPPLSGASLSYDPTGDFFLLFGGLLPNGSAYGGTWRFANFHWTDLTPTLPLAPPPQGRAPMAFDSADGYLLLVSALGSNRTWTFDGTSWAPRTTAASPPPSASGVLVDDPALAEVVLFGGYDPTGNTMRSGGTWLYHNGSWSLSAAGGAPGSARGATGCYDPRSETVLLFDGNGVGETWSFGSAGWVLDSGPSPGGPPAGLGEAVYYDSILGYEVLFGGTETASSVLSTQVWGWDVPAPYSDPTLTPASLPTGTLLELGFVIAVPILLVLLLRRRPPRPSATTVPRPASTPA